ncbi:Zn-dependent hydrolase [Promicromonospora thailandica]|uniref:Allantoate deiminase n=1 Tax=Promicromonospora thailandica TaxID=765201 RepID=A0A9X2FZB8_9MICO|nr:Zn-dependent hydrolase [Promicromonospora thailandica]MCP2264157.1 allantoate deiminase [Promicromonospora thailandica]BFF21175.1 allantoate amidohydrolase [Promicromonospora thailandica]
MTEPMTGTAAWVLERCDELTRHTARDDALERVYLSPEHAAANTAVAAWMRDAGLATATDAAGNLWGRRSAAGTPQQPGTRGEPALVLGSHLDTVPDAGRYDGMLGVALAIAVVHRLRGTALPFALEVAGFSDEEGARFGKALLGSCAASGQWDAAWWDQADADGVTLRDAFTAFGLDPGRVGAAARRPQDLVGYLEAHIEQGPELEALGLPLGYVTTIAGARRFVLTVTGEARHAGGTPYARRRDALVAAAHLVTRIEELAVDAGGLATVGELRVSPGAVNVIPGRAELTLDLRARTDAARDALWGRVAAAARDIARERHVSIEHAETHRAPSTTCDERMTAAVVAGIAAASPEFAGRADDVPGLWSPAGHDAMAMAAVTGVGMLFVRCRDGISHHADESVEAADVAAALDAYTAAVLALADKPVAEVAR